MLSAGNLTPRPRQRVKKPAGYLVLTHTASAGLNHGEDLASLPAMKGKTLRCPPLDGFQLLDSS